MWPVDVLCFLLACCCAIVYLINIELKFARGPLVPFWKAVPVLLMAVVAFRGSLGLPNAQHLVKFGRLMAAGLVFGAGGDILLGQSDAYFLPGLASFLVGHVCYIAAFVVGHSWRAAPLRAALPLAYAVVMFSILAKHLHAAFIVPVLLYCFTIASMVYRGLARSSAVFPLPSVQFSLIGCLFFLLSDSTLAINMFMSSFSAADQLVMSTYYVAQCCMGLSAATFVQGWPGLCTSSERTVGFFRCPARTEAAVAGAGQHDSLADDSKHLLVNEAASASSV